MSKFGIKIKNIDATQLFETNNNTRYRFSQKDAMLNNSLFSDFVKKNGLDIYKKVNKKRNQQVEIIEDGSEKEYTRDIICLSFNCGTKSYEEDIARINEQIEKASKEENDELVQFFLDLLEKANDNKDKYEKLSSEELRDKLYNDGISISYCSTDKNGNETKKIIKYKMLYRTSGKAKSGEVFYINEDLYDVTYDWLTMGLGKKMGTENAKIVELSAYAPLVTSSIVDRLHIPVEDILILKDVDSFFKTKSKIVKAQEYIDSKGKVRKKCIVEDGISEVKNTLWDGMALIESDITPKDSNGMVLLRNHMFKACAFKTYIQKFFKDWCSENDYDYETYTVTDIFGKEHRLKDIKIITTDNAIKWKKFVDIMGGTLESAYNYWCDRVNADGSIFGVVKTDHESKLGSFQRLSYQMVNSLPCTRQDIKEIVQCSLNYIEKIKNDSDFFEEYLRNNALEINSNEMLADIYKRNNDFQFSKYFKSRRSKIISNDIVGKMRKGKIFVNGDNLTICGNPYALLLYSVGGDYINDPTLQREDGTIQCYTERFDDDEFLCGFRNPHNSPNNICYLHNIKHPLMRKYFNFSKNIMAVNTIETDIQARANGCDYDSDFLLTTNQPNIVKSAKYCYEYYPTIVNELNESGITYDNTLSEYAKMDSKFAKTSIDIGDSSNKAQLGLTYYWTELAKENPNPVKVKELYDNFVILSVLAQCCIDSVKREFELDCHEEIDRISKMSCMIVTKNINTSKGVKSVKYDYPIFMKYTKGIKVVSDGKRLDEEKIKKERDKLNFRINEKLICPMNWLEEELNNIKYADRTETIDSVNFVITDYIGKNGNHRHKKTVLDLAEKLTYSLNKYYTSDMKDDKFALLQNEFEEAYKKLKKIKSFNPVTMNFLIRYSFRTYDKNYNLPNSKKIDNATQVLNILYNHDKELFLSNFVQKV